MKLLFDYFPIFIFFIGYKIFGIYAATAFAMVASFFQVVFFRLKYQRYEQMHLISLGLILVLGSATLFFHNPWFIIWKTTAIYWIFSLVFLGSSFIGKKPLIQRLMQGQTELPALIWIRLNTSWGLFFIAMGALNLYIAYHFDTDVWVNFKLFGGLGLPFLFASFQGVYLIYVNKHIKTIEKEPSITPP